MRREDANGQVRVGLGQLSGEDIAVDLWHDEVHSDNVEDIVRMDQRCGFANALGLGHFKAMPSQRASEGTAVKPVIIHQKQSNRLVHGVGHLLISKRGRQWAPGGEFCSLCASFDHNGWSDALGRLFHDQV